MKPFTESIRYDYPLTPESLVVDCGGYEGGFAREINQRYGCRVWCFEPIFHVKLTEALSDLYPKVLVWPCGLSFRNGRDSMGVKGDSSGLFVNGGPRVEVMLRDVVEAVVEPAALLKLNCEGAEFEILEAILDRGNPRLVENLQVQPHPIVPDYEARWQRIHDRLLVTHELTFHTPWCWSGYTLRK